MIREGFHVEYKENSIVDSTGLRFVIGNARQMLRTSIWLCDKKIQMGGFTILFHFECGYFVRRALTIWLFFHIRPRSSFSILQKTEMIMKMDWHSGKYLHNGKKFVLFGPSFHCEPHRSHGSSTRRSLINDTSRT